MPLAKSRTISRFRRKPWAIGSPTALRRLSRFVGRKGLHGHPRRLGYLGKLGPGLVGFAATAVAAILPGTLGWADPAETAQNAIRAALEDWRTAFNDRDQRRVCDLFAADLIANYQGQPERNHASLCELLRNSLQDTERTYQYSFKLNEILVYGEAAVVRLVWTLEI